MGPPGDPPHFRPPTAYPVPHPVQLIQGGAPSHPAARL
ncbi:MAG: hypothetical protein JWR64_2514, partial [Marmoricola sp.]|nr:hypothetical protein [Marmoricola sp.]